MNKNLFLALALILIACSPQVTEETDCCLAVTTASPQATETLIFTPTLEVPLLEAYIVEAQEYFGDGFTVTTNGKVIDKELNQEIPRFTIIPFNERSMIPPHGEEVSWGWQRVYEVEDNTDFTVLGTKGDITITENSGLDMYAWMYEEGEFKRQKVEFNAPNNGKVEIESYSPQEAQYLITINNSSDPNYRINSSEALRQLAIKIPKTIVNQDIYLTYKGMWELQDRIYKRYGNIFIPNTNPDDTWSKVDTTLFMVYPEFDDRSNALVVWMDANNKLAIIVVEGKYLDLPRYFNPYWSTHDIEDPFSDS